MNRSTWRATAALTLVLVAAVGGYIGWQQHRPAISESTGTTENSAPPAVASQPERRATPADAAASNILHPVDVPAGLPPLPPPDKAESYVNDRLADLFGRPAVLTLINADHFVAHFVATVDNLSRESASSKVWPVNPTPERFLVDSLDGQTVLSPKNAERYAPLVNLFDLIDVNSAVALYRHLYPLFQQAYEELGYPGKYFNDRLVAVIDQLQQTPEPTEPIALKLTEVKGPIPSTRPWVRYEFADSNLEARPAGQKILMRMGVANERRIKARLTEFRAQLVQGGTAR